jgi:hypothetical protein
MSLGRVGDVVLAQQVLDRPLVLAVAAPYARDRHVLVEGLVLLAGGGLDGGDDLAGDAQLGEGPERRLAVGPEVAHRLVEADHALLLDVVGVGADEEVAAGLGPGEAPVPLEERLERVDVALAVAGYQDVVCQIGKGGEVETECHEVWRGSCSGATVSVVDCGCWLVSCNQQTSQCQWSQDGTAQETRTKSVP